MILLTRPIGGADGAALPGLAISQAVRGLLQRTIDRGELAVELGAKPVHDRDDGKRDASCDQPVLDGGCAGFVVEESA